MDYEKKYKKALNLAKSYYEKEDGGANPFLDTLFPELRESEDERIRKEMVDYFSQYKDNGLRGVDITPWIAYLEKQKEQKPILKFKVGDKIHLIDGTSPNYEDDCITIREIDTINYIGEFKEGYVPIKEQDKWELVKEQKPAEWSEEDDMLMDELESYILYDSEFTEEQKKWRIERLKSLRPN